MTFQLLQSTLTFSQWVWGASAQAAVLVCLILIVRALLHRWLTPDWSCKLWLLVLLRLALPWQPESAWSVYNLWPAASQSSLASEPARPEPPRPGGDRVQSAANAPTLNAADEKDTAPDAPVLAVPDLQAPAPEAAAPLPQPAAPSLTVSWTHLIAGGWLAGALLVLATMIWQSVRFARRMKRGRAVTDPRLLELLENCKLAMGVRGWLAVIESAEVANPALVGFIRPSLILPRGLAERLTPQRQRFVLLHELAHLRRHDIAIGCLTGLLLALHWFNPLAWLAVRRMRADRELASDALALAHAEPGESSEYGRTIIDLMIEAPPLPRLATVAGILENHDELKRRIEMIMSFRPTSRLSSLAACALFLALALTTLTGAQSNGAAAPGAPAPTAFKVMTTTNAQGRFVDTINFPFVSDPQAVGHWESVDFVTKMTDFTPGKRQWKSSSLFLKTLDLKPGGKTNYFFTWTKGLLLHANDKTASHYVIKPLAGAQYMFLEWKSGDYTIRHMAPKYYVLKKSGVSAAAPAVAAPIRAVMPTAPKPAPAADLAQKIAQLQLGVSTREDAIRIFGRPESQSGMCLVWPNGFEIFFVETKATEVRFEMPGGTGYRFHGKLQVSSSLADVVAVVGQPMQTVVSSKNEFQPNVLYKDIDGKAGYCYYARPDQGVRFFFVNGKVTALYLTSVQP